MRRTKAAAVLATSAALVTLAACGGGGGNDDETGSGSSGEGFQDAAETIAKDAERQGPAAEVEGASAGGTITVVAL